MYVFSCVGMYEYMCGGQRTTCGVVFSFPGMDPGYQTEQTDHLTQLISVMVLLLLELSDSQHGSFQKSKTKSTETLMTKLVDLYPESTVNKQEH